MQCLPNGLLPPSPRHCAVLPASQQIIRASTSPKPYTLSIVCFCANMQKTYEVPFVGLMSVNVFAY